MVTIVGVGSADGITRTRVLLPAGSHRLIGRPDNSSRRCRNPPIASWQIVAGLKRWSRQGCRVREDRVRVLVVGSDRFATSLASRLRRAGHMAGTHQNLEDVTGLRTLALGAQAVFLVVPLRHCLQLPHRVLLGRVVADATDYFPTDDSDAAAHGESPSELLSAHLPGAGFVRIVNAIRLLSMREKKPVGGTVPRVSVPIAGDDLPAKAAISGLIVDLGLDVVDVGRLADARTWQPESTLRSSSSRDADPRIRIADV
jgi:predicted dinucleotide-binding enzyme